MPLQRIRADPAAISRNAMVNAADAVFSGDGGWEGETLKGCYREGFPMAEGLNCERFHSRVQGVRVPSLRKNVGKHTGKALCRRSDLLKLHFYFIAVNRYRFRWPLSRFRLDFLSRLKKAEPGFLRAQLFLLWDFFTVTPTRPSVNYAAVL